MLNVACLQQRYVWLTWCCPYAQAAFGGDGHLYVAGLNSSNVLRYDGMTGAPMGVFVSAGLGGLNGAESVLFHPDGDLLVVSLNNSSVLKYSAKDGSFVGVFVSAFSGGLSQPHDAIYGPNGNLFTAGFGNNKVIEYDGESGAFIRVVVEDDPATPGVDETGGLSAAHSLAFGPDGLLYVPSFGTSEVLQYDPTDGSFLGVYIGTGLSAPTALLFLEADDPADIDGDGLVAFSDLLAVISNWGPCPDPPAPCPADINGDRQSFAGWS